MANAPKPVVFVHGLWLHGTSWDPWVQLFTEKGYQPVAPGWPGDAETVEQTRVSTDAIANHGIEDVTENYRRYIEELPVKPVVIGHSFGGLIAEKLLGEDYAAAAIGIDAAQIKGVLPLPLSSIKVTVPVFKDPSNIHKAVGLTADQFKYGFGNQLTDEESNALWEKWAMPSPARPLFEAAEANFVLHSPAKVNTRNADRGPLLLTMGGEDHTVPEAITKATVKQYKHSVAETDVIEFTDRGHSLTIDHGWRDIAGACLDWLDNHGL